MGKSSPREKAISALMSVTRNRRSPDELWKVIYSAFSGFASDQTIALVFGAALEQALEIAISTHFVLDAEGCARMFNTDTNMPPIPTFAAKISLGYALGIFEKHIREELSLIKAIRNAFAHSTSELSFDDSVIVNACKFLWLPTKWRKADGSEYSHKEMYMESIRSMFLYLEDPDRGVKPKRYSTSRSYNLLALSPPLTDRPS